MLFRSSWLEQTKFSDWLEKRFNSSQKCYIAYCKICNEFKTNGKSKLLKHFQTLRHNRFKKVLEENETLCGKLDSYLNYTTDKAVIIVLELRLILFLVENNRKLIAVLRVCFQKDSPLQ